MKEVTFSTIAVIGAGAMGRGIAQIAAQAGSRVKIFDTQPETLASAREAVFSQWDRLEEKGRLSPESVVDNKARLTLADHLSMLHDCDLVIEAIVERLDVKKTLFAELEAIVGPDTVLVTNTSSLSVTAIAAGLKRPGRFAGYHFFNPVPLMKVVEVIAGLKTDPAALRRTDALRPPDGTHAGDRRRTRPASSSTMPAAVMAPRPCASWAKASPISPRSTGSSKIRPASNSGPFELFDLTALDVSHPGHGVDLPAVFRGAALPPQRDHGAAPGWRHAGQEGWRRFLPL